MKVLYGGGFDIFHWMHLESLKRAKAQGDYLIVMVNSDRLIEEYKGKKPLFTEYERADIIRNLKFVDEVVIKDTFDSSDLIKGYNIDVLVYCDEWAKDKQDEIELMKERGGKVVFIPYLKSSKMPDVKAKFAELMNQKTKILCENCHKAI